MNSAVYLDYNAAAPLRPAAREKMIEVLSLTGNPASIHRFGRELSGILETARHDIAQLLDAQASEIIFTSCASEANTAVLQSAATQGLRVLIGATEHASVLKAASSATIIPVDAQGVLRIDILETLLQERSGPTLVSVQAANGETGVLQPLETVISLAKSYGAFFHTDAVQAVGRLPVSFKSLGCDALTVASSKIGGPSGAGCLILKKSTPFSPLIRGGGQEKNRRAGTAAVAAQAGFSTALKAAVIEDWKPIALLRETLERQLLTLYPSSEIYGRAVPRLSNTTCVRLPGLRNDLQLMKLDLAGFAISAGSACSSGKIEPSAVLQALGISAQHAQESVRISLSPTTSYPEIEAFLEAWAALIPLSFPSAA